MPNTSGGANAICPYFKSDATNSITCTCDGGACDYITKFNNKKDKQLHIDNVCSTYNYGSCKLAKLLDSDNEQTEHKSLDELNDEEKKIYNYLVWYVEKHHTMPTLRMLCKEFYYSSLETAADRLKQLEQKGVLERVDGTSKRSYKLKHYKITKVNN